MVSGAPCCVVKSASAAASLTGWSRARWRADRSPETGWRIAAGVAPPHAGSRAPQGDKVAGTFLEEKTGGPPPPHPRGGEGDTALGNRPASSRGASQRRAGGAS